MFTWMQIMMGSQGLIQKAVPHHWCWISAGFIQELCAASSQTTKCRALWFISWPELSFSLSLSFLADVENEEWRQIKWDFNASFLGHALNTHARRDKKECLWISVCNCVSLQCPIPATITACHLFFFRLGVYLHLARTELMKNGFDEKKLWHSTVRQTLVIQAQYHEHDIHCSLWCHWSCVHWMKSILEKPLFWWCWDKHQWLLH